MKDERLYYFNFKFSITNKVKRISILNFQSDPIMSAGTNERKTASNVLYKLKWEKIINYEKWL